MKKQFPIFSNHPQLVYLDSAATTQTPAVVIERVSQYMTKEHANIHRGLYDLSAANTAQYEQTRQTIRSFFSAPTDYEVIYTSGATHGLNLIANGLTNTLTKKSVILVSRDSHHSNIIPWQQLAHRTGAQLVYLPLQSDGSYKLEALEPLLSSATVIALPHVSNVTGTIHPITEIVAIAKRHHCLTIIDGAQAVHHFPVSLATIDCDAYVFSGHKVYGPTGIGAALIKKELAAKLDPLLFGGSMVTAVSEQKATWADMPHRFEAGTPHLAGVVGMATALTWLEKNDRAAIWQEEQSLIKEALTKLAAIKHVSVIGPSKASQRAGVISMTIEGVHPHDVAQLLNDDAIAVRAGHHCAQLIHQFFDTSASLRISFGAYNTKEDVDRFIISLKKAITTLHV